MYCQSNVIQHGKNCDFIERIQWRIIDNSTTTVCCGFALCIIYSKGKSKEKDKEKVKYLKSSLIHSALASDFFMHRQLAFVLTQHSWNQSTTNWRSTFLKNLNLLTNVGCKYCSILSLNCYRLDRRVSTIDWASKLMDYCLPCQNCSLIIKWNWQIKEPKGHHKMKSQHLKLSS